MCIFKLRRMREGQVNWKSFFSLSLTIIQVPGWRPFYSLEGFPEGLLEEGFPVLPHVDGTKHDYTSRPNFYHNQCFDGSLLRSIPEWRITTLDLLLLCVRSISLPDLRRLRWEPCSPYWSIRSIGWTIRSLYRFLEHDFVYVPSLVHYRFGVL